MGCCASIHKRKASTSHYPIMGCSVHKHLARQISQLRVKRDIWEIIEKANFDSEDFKFAKSVQETMTDSMGEFLLPHRVARLILEFKRFIYLSCLWQELRASLAKNSQLKNRNNSISYEKYALLPSPTVDRVWQILMSHTSCYRTFTEGLLGDRILPRVSTLKPHLAHYSLTLHLYNQKFGKPDAQFWPEYVTSQELKLGYSGFCCFPTNDFLLFRETLELEKTQEEHKVGLKEFQTRMIDMIEVMKAKNAYVELTQLKQEPILQVNPPIIFDQDVQLLMSESKHKTSKILERINEEIIDEKIEIVISAPPSVRGMSEESAQDYNFNMSGLDQHVETSNKNMRKDSRTPSFMSERITRETNISPMGQTGAGILETDESPVSQVHSLQQPNFSISSLESEPVQYKASPSKTINSYYCDTTLSIGTIELDSESLEAKIKHNKPVYQKLQSYELPDEVLVRFSQDYNAPPSFTLSLFADYKRYLFIKRVSQGIQKTECSRLIRIAWHYHVVYSQNYQHFCRVIFDEYIDTEPLPRLIGLQVKRNYVRTLATYRKIFGQITDLRIWPNVDMCFNEEVNYSYKLFNVHGYIDRVLQCYKKKRNRKGGLASPRKRMSKCEAEWKLIQQSKRALAHMVICRKPDRGKYHLKRESRSGTYFDDLESYASFV